MEVSRKAKAEFQNEGDYFRSPHLAFNRTHSIETGLAKWERLRSEWRSGSGKSKRIVNGVK